MVLLLTLTMLRQAFASCRSQVAMLQHVKSLSCAPQRVQRQHRQIFNMAKGFGFGFAKPAIGLSGRPTLKPGKVAPKSVVPANIPKPPYADTGVFPAWSETEQIHDATVSRFPMS